MGMVKKNLRWCLMVFSMLPPLLLAISSQAQTLDWDSARTLLLANNPDLQLLKASVDGAEADQTTAGERPNPTFSTLVSQIKIGPRQPGQGMGGGGLASKNLDSIARVDWPLERGDKRQLRLNLAAHTLDASRQDLHAGTQTLLINLDNAFYDVWLAQKTLELTQKTYAADLATLAAAEKRQRAGDIASADVTRIRVDTLRSANDLAADQADLQQKREALALLLGNQVDTTDLTVNAPEPQPVSATEPALDSWLDQNPQYRAADARAKAAEQNLALTQAQRHRDVVVSGQFENNPPDNRNTVGIGISVPLFYGSTFDGEIRRAESDLNSARLDAQRIREQLRQQLHSNYLELQRANAAAQRYRQSILDQAAQAVAAAEFAYQRGASGVMDVLDARRTYYALQKEGLQADSDLARASLAWQLLISPENQAHE